VESAKATSVACACSRGVRNGAWLRRVIATDYHTNLAMGMETRELFTSRQEVVDGGPWHVYRAAATGRHALRGTKKTLREPADALML
jgi:hypothetical protein